MIEKEEKYVPMGTKVSPGMATVINAICDATGNDVYHLLQYFLYTLVRAASEHHEMTPEIQELLGMMKTDVAWTNAFNLCNPDGLEVSQCILILEQKGKKGFGAVMLEKPFMGNCQQTENVDKILECVTEATMYEVYGKVRKMNMLMRNKSTRETLNAILDAQMFAEFEEQDRAEMAGAADYTETGQKYAYGKNTKRKQHRTPDTGQQMRIMFEDEDREAAEREAEWSEGENEGEEDEGCRDTVTYRTGREAAGKPQRAGKEGCRGTTTDGTRKKGRSGKERKETEEAIREGLGGEPFGVEI